jgi:ribosomal protein S18 acetylase RimI-like enzyme
MSEVRVRAARVADIADVERIVAAAFRPFTRRTGIVPAPMSTDWATTISAAAASVAVVDDRVVGVLVLWPHPDHVLVDTIAVDPAAQGRGVGSALLAHAEAGARVLRLYTNAGMTEALAYYPRRGFALTGRRREDGFDRVLFEKRLG